MNSDARPAARLTLLTGPSGAGKESVAGSVRARAPLVWVGVPATTRPRHPSEVDGEDHVFVGRTEFEGMIAAGQMLEWSQLGEHLYGTSRSAILDRLAGGRQVLLCLDPPGARQVRAAMPGTRLVLLVPPAADPGRAPALHALEMARAVGVADGVDAVVVNDHLGRAAGELLELLGSSLLTPARPRVTLMRDTEVNPRGIHRQS